VTSRFRFRLASAVASLSIGMTLVLAVAGCGDAFWAGPMKYVENEKLAADLKDKPELQKAVRKSLAELFGPDPTHIKVPEGSGLPVGGIYLANFIDHSGGKFTKTGPVLVPLKVEGKIVTKADGKPVGVQQQGGYALYRQHCLHCHGVSGAGDGPTAPFLYPRPRDYRRGLFKFTSTNTGQKPTRDDLLKTIRNGLHGTSMPAFEPLMSEVEIEQVVDYMIFLSARGETELSLIDEASSTGELTSETAADIARSVFRKWQNAGKQVLNPPIAKPPSNRESVLRGRDLFLSLNKTGNKVDCTSCHGPQALGNGPSFVKQEVFNEVLFGGDPSTMAERVAGLAEADRKIWKESLDDWGQPLRPNNLNRGVYKGGRRPIDIYWRIAKGINGAKMPAHFPTLEPEKIWDLVNFVLALPYQPALLEGAKLPETRPETAPKVANR
jgi:mono/diheme cytochrome c family protein